MRLQEIEIAKRLRFHGAGIITQGTTTEPLRKERAREAIKANMLETVIAGKFNDKPEAYADYFARIYSEKL